MLSKENLKNLLVIIFKYCGIVEAGYNHETCANIVFVYISSAQIWLGCFYENILSYSYVKKKCDKQPQLVETWKKTKNYKRPLLINYVKRDTGKSISNT